MIRAIIYCYRLTLITYRKAVFFKDPINFSDVEQEKEGGDEKVTK